MRATWKGLKALDNKFEDMRKLNAAKVIVKKNGAQLDRRMIDNAQFIKGYSTGQTRRSINLLLEDDDMTAVVQPSTEYSSYLEYGTRLMDAQPFIKPAWQVQKEIFKNDLDKLVE